MTIINLVHARVTLMMIINIYYLMLGIIKIRGRYSTLFDTIKYCSSIYKICAVELSHEASVFNINDCTYSDQHRLTPV